MAGGRSAEPPEDSQDPPASRPQPGGSGQPALIVGLVLLKVGVIAFGGPITHVAFMRRELVERRGWLDEKTFLRMFAACNLIPGPSSTELAIFIGYRLAGWSGRLSWLPLSGLPGFVVLAHSDRLPVLIWTFLKLGAVSFGSGYVLFAYLQSDFVQGLHWLSQRQLIDAIAISQVTPGPVFTTATFLGYLFAGLGGALLATLALFLPGFVLVPFLDRIVRLVEERPPVRAFLDGVNLAVISLIAAVTIQLGVSSVHSPSAALVALASFLVLLWRPLATPVLVLAGGCLGL